MNNREQIAKRIAKEFKDGDFVNLGSGIPTLVGNYLDPSVRVVTHSEGGIIGCGPKDPDIPEEYYDIYCRDAANNAITYAKGGATCDSAMSFGLVRGGHLDYTVLGTMQVDQEGNLANWRALGGKLAGIGGAMDLATGAKSVIVATTHCDKAGVSKLMDKCTFPLTGMACVDLVVTELCVMKIDREKKCFILTEYAPGVSVETILQKTPNCHIVVSPDVKEMDLS